jgi:hypothetical protein
MIVTSEADIAKVPSMQDRRELRNFMRFLRLWPIHGYDMLERPRWRKYLAINEAEAASLQRNPRAGRGSGHNGNGNG